MKRLLLRLVPPVALTAAVAGALANPASAAESVTQHFSTDVAGSGVTITCGQLSLVPTSGTLDGVFHENADGHGDYHYTGSNVARGVVLTDGSGGSYRLQGTSSFSGTSRDAAGEDNVVFTTTVAFVVLNSTGGRLGDVHVLEHLSPGGHVQLDSGSCTGTGGEG